MFVSSLGTMLQYILQIYACFINILPSPVIIEPKQITLSISS